MPFLRFILGLPAAIIRATVIYLPGESGILLRRWYYGRKLKRCGKDLTILPGVHIDDPACIEVGDDVMIREYAIIRTTIPPVTDSRDCRWIGGEPGASDRGIIRIGDHARIAFNALLLGYGGIKIGRKCGIGPGSVILSESYHHKGSHPNRIYKYSQGADPEELSVLRGTVELKDGAGLASRVIVLPGAVIGHDSWVAPNSVVRIAANITDRVIVKGDPAKTVQRRSPERKSTE